MNMNTTCRCQHCNSYIEFQLEDAGKSGDCPSCGMETILFQPPKPPHISTVKAAKTRMRNAITACALAVFGIFSGIIIYQYLLNSSAKDFTNIRFSEIAKTTPATVPIPAPAQEDDYMTKWKKHLDERLQRLTNHYNSPGEVLYREMLDKKRDFLHQRIMNEIQNGSGDRTVIELMKLRHEIEINKIESEHAIEDAEWKRKEDAAYDEWVPDRNIRKTTCDQIRPDESFATRHKRRINRKSLMYNILHKQYPRPSRRVN